MTILSRRTSGTLAAAFALATPSVLLAHAGHGVAEGGSLAAGLLHPVLGLDHLLAMVASGLLAVRIGTKRALWAVPASFIGLMLAGGLLACAGVALPVAEWGIALSVVVLGLAVALLPRVSMLPAALLVGLFAVCHGHAHVAELGGHALVPYTAGFLLSTAGLHALAIAAGLGLARADKAVPVRIAGGAVAAMFCAMLLVM